jgi:hypothetical protein
MKVAVSRLPAVTQEEVLVYLNKIKLDAQHTMQPVTILPDNGLRLLFRSMAETSENRIKSP